MSRPQKVHKHKTRFIAYAAVSIDGRISLDRKKLPDWTSPEDWKFFQAALKKAEAVVVGSGTYKVARERLDKRVTYVLTSKVKESKKKGSTTLINPNHVDLGATFAEYKNVAIVGGAEAYQTMLNEDLFDELFLTIEPVLFGRGRELFSGGKANVSMRLVSVRKLNRRGTILLHYERQRN